MGKGGRCPETRAGRYARCETPKPSWGSSALRRDTGEPGAPKGARPVRGGADGKVLTEQLASRLLHRSVVETARRRAIRAIDAIRLTLQGTPLPITA